MLGVVPWNWPLPWQPFRRRPAYICALLSEWDVWSGASSVPLGRLSWHNPLICCSPSAAVTALYRPSRGWLCCFFILLLLHRLHRISSTFLCNQLLLCGCSRRHCFLPISDFNRFRSCLWRLFHATSFLLLKRQDIMKLQRFCFPTYHLFTGNLSPAASGLGIWYVRAASLNWEKDLGFLFLPLQTQTPPMAVRCSWFHFWDEPEWCSKFANVFQQTGSSYSVCQTTDNVQQLRDTFRT